MTAFNISFPVKSDILSGSG